MGMPDPGPPPPPGMGQFAGGPPPMQPPPMQPPSMEGPPPPQQAMAPPPPQELAQPTAVPPPPPPSDAAIQPVQRRMGVRPVREYEYEISNRWDALDKKYVSSTGAPYGRYDLGSFTPEPPIAREYTWLRPRENDDELMLAGVDESRWDEVERRLSLCDAGDTGARPGQYSRTVTPFLPVARSNERNAGGPYGRYEPFTPEPPIARSSMRRNTGGPYGRYEPFTPDPPIAREPTWLRKRENDDELMLAGVDETRWNEVERRVKMSDAGDVGARPGQYSRTVTPFSPVAREKGRVTYVASQQAKAVALPPTSAMPAPSMPATTEAVPAQASN